MASEDFLMSSTEASLYYEEDLLRGAQGEGRISNYSPHSQPAIHHPPVYNHLNFRVSDPPVPVDTLFNELLNINHSQRCLIVLDDLIRLFFSMAL